MKTNPNPTAQQIETDERGVVLLDADDPRATVCEDCGAAWDDSVSTSVTPVPAGRCPWEHEHRDEDGEPTGGYCDVCGTYTDGCGIVNQHGDLLCVLCAQDACGVCGSPNVIYGACADCEQAVVDRARYLLYPKRAEAPALDDLRQAHADVLDLAVTVTRTLNEVLDDLRQAVLDQAAQDSPEPYTLLERAQAVRAHLAGLDRLQRRLADALAVAAGLPPHP